MSTEEKGPLEKRESARIALEVEVVINAPTTGHTIWGWIENISRGGFKIKAGTSLTLATPLSEGNAIHFETFEDFFRLRGRGTIVWIHQQEDLTGIKFDNLEEESKKSLEGFLEIFEDNPNS